MLARGGQETEIVSRDNHYSPFFQVGTLLSSASRTFPFPGLSSDLWWASLAKLLGVNNVLGIT